MKSVDIIVAVCNEEELIRPFVDLVKALKLPQDIRVGIIFIEDSSTDRTRDVLREVCAADSSIRFFSLERGYGQAPALWFGMQRSNADAVITMDVDQGHPVSVIPSMIEAWLSGFDIVQGVRMDISGRPAYRDAGTLVFDLVVRLVTGVDLRRQNVHFRLMSRTVRDEFLGNPQWIYFLRYHFPPKQYRVKYIEFASQERTAGNSKFDFRKLLVHSLRGILSIIPAKRFWIIMLLILLVSIVAGLFIHLVIGCVLLLSALIVIECYRRMCKNQISDQMRIIEQSECE